MGKGRPQLTEKEVERGLSALGFEMSKQDGTSHRHWKKVFRDRLRKVTVDPPKAPFSNDMITFMSRQAGLTKKEFYEICTKDGAKKAAKGKLSWAK